LNFLKDPKVQMAIVGAVLIIIGAITEAAVAWINYLENQAGV